MLSSGAIGVFISSTVEDLENYREAAKKAVLGWQCYPVMMEHWPSMDQNAIQACMGKVDEADIFICIVAHRYGFIPEGSEISITQMETERAKAKNKPRLFFTINEDMEWSPKLIDIDEPAKSKLLNFKKEIDSQFRKEFTNPISLELEITKALRDVLISRPKSPVGVRIGSFDLNDLTLPIQSTTSENEILSSITLVLKGNPTEFKSQIINFKSELSKMLNITADQIHIQAIIEGSIWVQLLLPSIAANKLYDLAYAEKQMVVVFPEEILQHLRDFRDQIFSVVVSVVYLVVIVIVEIFIRPLVNNQLFSEATLFLAELILVIGLITKLLSSSREVIDEIINIKRILRLKTLDYQVIVKPNSMHNKDDALPLQSLDTEVRAQKSDH